MFYRDVQYSGVSARQKLTVVASLALYRVGYEANSVPTCMSAFMLVNAWLVDL